MNGAITTLTDRAVETTCSVLESAQRHQAER